MKKAIDIFCLILLILMGCNSTPSNNINTKHAPTNDSNPQKNKINTITKQQTLHDTNCKYSIEIDTIIERGQGPVWGGGLVIYFMSINVDSVTIYLNGKFYTRKYHVIGNAGMDAPYVVEIPKLNEIQSIGLQINDGRVASFSINKRRKSVGVYFYKGHTLNIKFYNGRLEFG